MMENIKTKTDDDGEFNVLPSTAMVSPRASPVDPQSSACSSSVFDSDHEILFHIVSLPYRISEFPFPPYPTQEILMHRIIHPVVRGENALLESRTGSGKTIAMIHSVTAAVRFLQQPPTPPLEGDTSNADFPDTQLLLSPSSFPSSTVQHDFHISKPQTVFLVTKTHAQITQIIRKIRTCNIPDLTVTVLGSRRHTCLNEAVLSSDDINTACRKLTSWQKPFFNLPIHRHAASCMYFSHNFEAKVKQIASNIQTQHNVPSLPPVADIEDLKTFGSYHRVCPFYFTKLTYKSDDIVLCPYPYLMTPEIRKAMQISIRNNNVVVDEAHNIPSVGRSQISWSVDSFTFQQCTAIHISRETSDSICFLPDSADVQVFRTLLAKTVNAIPLGNWSVVTKLYKCHEQRGQIAQSETILSILFGSEMLGFLSEILYVRQEDVNLLFDNLQALRTHNSSCTSDKDLDVDDESNDNIVSDVSSKLVCSLRNLFTFPDDMALAITMKKRYFLRAAFI